MTATEIGKKHGVTETTPDNVLLGAGIIVSGLTFANSKWTYTTVYGATSGGSKLEIKPELQDLEIDGVLVKTKGMTVKVGETAQLTTSLAEVTKENLKMASLGKVLSTTEGYDEIVSKKNIEKDDYIKDLGFIGYTLDGDPIIVKFDNALCTSGLSFEAKNKGQATVECTFECYAEITNDDLSVLPWHVYTKTVASV